MSSLVMLNDDNCIVGTTGGQIHWKRGDIPVASSDILTLYACYDLRYGRVRAVLAWHDKFHYILMSTAILVGFIFKQKDSQCDSEEHAGQDPFSCRTLSKAVRILSVTLYMALF